ncbi:cupin domain-containing protein [Myxosarcina sp. GI1]|uniref:cupin domain-containing protein n=1 Tax=Myxosarcina sp. GI1 TaxID=1541065 RepID=UPI0005662753|nr:cupin domain-containing protein [Myxosarcina sp. GI1]
MNQAHFPDKIRTLPIFQGRFEANRLTTENVDIYFASYSQGTEIEAHQHNSDNHGVVTQGELILIVDGKEEYYSLGDWYHLKPHQVHAARFDRDTFIIEFWFK